MTNEEIRKQLSKIPKEDMEKINNLKSLSPEEMTSVTGGLKLSRTTKDVIKGLVAAGVITATTFAAYKSGENRGRKSMPPNISENDRKKKKKIANLFSSTTEKVKNGSLEFDEVSSALEKGCTPICNQISDPLISNYIILSNFNIRDLEPLFERYGIEYKG